MRVKMRRGRFQGARTALAALLAFAFWLFLFNGPDFGTFDTALCFLSQSERRSAISEANDAGARLLAAAAEIRKQRNALEAARSRAVASAPVPKEYGASLLVSAAELRKRVDAFEAVAALSKTTASASAPTARKSRLSWESPTFWDMLWCASDSPFAYLAKAVENSLGFLVWLFGKAVAVLGAVVVEIFRVLANLLVAIAVILWSVVAAIVWACYRVIRFATQVVGGAVSTVTGTRGRF